MTKDSESRMKHRQEEELENQNGVGEKHQKNIPVTP